MAQLQLLFAGGYGHTSVWDDEPACPTYAPTTEASRKLLDSIYGCGSGGVITLEEIQPIGAKVFKSNVRSPKENLEHIRDVLNPSMSELATIVGVSRQSVYSWLRHSRISKKHDKQLLALAEAADVLANSRIEINPWLLQREIVNNQTLYQICAAGGDVVDAARQLVKVCQDEAHQRQHLDALFADLPKRPPSEESDLPYVVDDDA